MHYFILCQTELETNNKDDNNNNDNISDTWHWYVYFLKLYKLLWFRNNLKFLS